ncbi:hypothetical protein D3C87_1788950 [compost metagenome]
MCLRGVSKKHRVKVVNEAHFSGVCDDSLDHPVGRLLVAKLLHKNLFDRGSPMTHRKTKCLVVHLNQVFVFEISEGHLEAAFCNPAPGTDEV